MLIDNIINFPNKRFQEEYFKSSVLHCLTELHNIYIVKKEKVILKNI